MRGVERTDVAVAGVFVLAAVAEAVARDAGNAARLLLEVSSALVLGTLALRRGRPVLVLTVVAAAAVAGLLVTRTVWPNAPDDGGVWLFAVALAAYSVGAHARGAAVLLGVLVPFGVVVVADHGSSGRPWLSGVLFVTVFLGALPVGVGRAVRARHDRIRLLHDRHRRLLETQRVRRESAVLAERLRTSEHVRRTLVTRVRSLAGPGQDPATVEAAARDLLARTRREVLALATPAPDSEVDERPVPDPLPALRASAQPWAVLSGGAVALGLSVETARTVPLAVPVPVAMAGAAVVGLLLALVWWRPFTAAVLTWAALTAYSHLIAPLDGHVSAVAAALGTALAVGALCRRWWAAAGLVVCCVGQVVGVHVADPLGDVAFLALGWLGGLAVQEAGRLVEQIRETTERLAEQEGALEERALVEERLRLARDVHDSLGHTLTVLALHAGAARRLAATDPARSRKAMRTVAAVARQAVDQDTGLEGLLDRVRDTGLVVGADLEALTGIDADRRETAFHVVREALTNAMRHAPGARVDIEVTRCDDDVLVSVTSAAATRPGQGPGTGTGLAGLRERVGTRGGEATWGPTPDGGFVVRALLPAARSAGAEPEAVR